jgi:hypothetical protein
MSPPKEKFKVVNSSSKLKSTVAKLPDTGFDFRALRGREKGKKDDAPESIGLFVDAAAGSDFNKEKAKIASGQFFQGTLKKSTKDPKGRLVLVTRNSARPLIELARVCLKEASLKHKIVVLQPDAVEPDAVDDDDAGASPQVGQGTPAVVAPQKPPTTVPQQPPVKPVQPGVQQRPVRPTTPLPNQQPTAKPAIGQAPQTAKPVQATAQPADTGKQAESAEAAVYKQSKLVWESTRDKVHSELQKLEAAILAVYEGDSDLPKVTGAVRRLDTVLQRFDRQLVDKIDALNSAGRPTDRQRLHGEARQIVARYQGVLDTDPLVRKLDTNPFVAVGVEASLKKSLALLASRLA